MNDFAMLREMSQRDLYREKLNIIPQRSQDGLVRYIERGTLPGNFLQALLANDLTRAVLNADELNLASLHEWCLYAVNYLPADCWGSPEKVRDWSRRGGLQGMNSTGGQHG